MSVYNGERFLGEAIESILNQTFRDFEFIIVDDASTDGTRNIIEHYKKTDVRIVSVINERNMERAVSRNKGIRIAQGEYLSIIDSDDISLPEKLARQVEYLDRNSGVGFVGTAWCTIDERGHEIAEHELPETNAGNIIHFMCRPSIMTRKYCVEKAGGYNADFVPSEDYDLWLRVAEMSSPAAIRDRLFKYRVHSKSSTVLQRYRMDASSSMAIWMSIARKDRGHKLTYIQKVEVERAWKSRLKASWLGRRIIVSKNRTFWSEAALSLGEMKKAYVNATSAITSFPFNLKAWFLLMKVIGGCSTQYLKRVA
jgi:glycosyltransferase involved in cell wall biosynthesis